MFNVPHWKYTIDPNSYDKDKLLEDVNHNYSLDKSRNKWDKGNFLASDLHHSNRDKGNPKFRNINYAQVTKQYQSIFTRFCNELELTKTFNYEFNVVNYTAMKSGQYMRPHNHIGDSDFTCIHYVKFNSKKHQSTVFHNANHWADDFQYLRPELYSKLDPGNEKHSYLLKYYQIPTKENDFIITPSAVLHEVPSFKSDELRVTLVVNLQIK